MLGPSQARQEAEYLVAQQQVWVHTISTEDVEEDIACIVAVTRTSETTAAITKVFTNAKWRKRGCAERLVREVCQEYVFLSEFTIFRILIPLFEDYWRPELILSFTLGTVIRQPKYTTKLGLSD